MNFAASWVQFPEQVSTTSIDNDRGCESAVVDPECLDLGRGRKVTNFFKKQRNEEIYGQTEQDQVGMSSLCCSVAFAGETKKRKWRGRDFILLKISSETTPFKSIPKEKKIIKTTPFKLFSGFDSRQTSFSIIILYCTAVLSRVSRCTYIYTLKNWEFRHSVSILFSTFRAILMILREFLPKSNSKPWFVPLIKLQYLLKIL